jgi:hypothetical protein
MVTLFSLVNPKIERDETRLYSDSPFFPRSLAAGLDDFKQVKIMIQTVHWLAIFDQRAHHLR